MATGAQATGITLDAGALIALERANEAVLALLDAAERLGRPVAVPAGALAQAWRASARQHRLALLVSDADAVEVPPLDVRQALAVGAVLAAAGTADVVDATVVVSARGRGHWVVTTDPDDLRRLNPDLPLIHI